jgi:Uncharacterized protein conserved in bacteria
MKKIISILIVVTIVLSISVTAFAETEGYPYMAESNEDLAFRDADGVFLKNLPGGQTFVVLGRDNRDSERVWVEWAGCEGSIIERGITRIDREVNLSNSNEAYLTGSLNLRNPETYEFITLLSSGTRVEVVGKDPFHPERTVVRTDEYEGSVLSSYVMKTAYADFILVEIDNQKAYLYKGGELISCSDVVTGFLNWRDTPRGVFSIQDKMPSKTLVGEDYETPVNFWMPFCGGCGFHSAEWRWSFGGNIYTYDGSHGCVNCPYDFAKLLYENSYIGMTVIVA